MLPRVSELLLGVAQSQRLFKERAQMKNLEEMGKLMCGFNAEDVENSNALLGKRSTVSGKNFYCCKFKVPWKHDYIIMV